MAVLSLSHSSNTNTLITSMDCCRLEISFLSIQGCYLRFLFYTAIGNEIEGLDAPSSRVHWRGLGENSWLTMNSNLFGACWGTIQGSRTINYYPDVLISFGIFASTSSFWCARNPDYIWGSLFLRKYVFGYRGYFFLVLFLVCNGKFFSAIGTSFGCQFF